MNQQTEKAAPAIGPIEIASSRGTAYVRSAGVEVGLRVQPEVMSSLTSELRRKRVGCAALRVYMTLEGVLGTFDAAVLQVFLANAPRVSAGLETDALLGSIGLYGLRIASLPDADGVRRGLKCYVDITPHSMQPEMHALLAQHHLQLSIRPANKFPDGVEVSIENIRIYVEGY